MRMTILRELTFAAATDEISPFFVLLSKEPSSELTRQLFPPRHPLLLHLLTPFKQIAFPLDIGGGGDSTSSGVKEPGANSVEFKFNHKLVSLFYLSTSNPTGETKSGQA